MKKFDLKKLLPPLVFTGLYGLTFLFLFTTSERISPTFTTKAAMALLTVLCAGGVCFGDKLVSMKKYRAPGTVGVLWAIGLYASLATFGQRFFLEGNTRIHFSGEGAVYCLAGMVWYLPILWTGLVLLELASVNREKREPEPKLRRRRFWQLFAVFGLVQTGLLAIFWPGFFPEDAMNQLLPALGLAPLNDWHPVLNSLIQRVILWVVPSASAIVAVQMLLFAALVTAFLMIGWDYGMHWLGLAVGGSVFLLLPNQALSWSNAMKDYAFTLALMWGAYLLLQAVLKRDWTKKWHFYGCVALDLFLMYGLRHNGMLPFAAVTVLCLIFAIRDREGLWRRMVLACVAAALAVAVYKGPVYSALKVIPNIQSPFTSMLCAVGSYINKGLPLSEEAERIMEEVIPMEDWADYYSRFEGHDTYYWNRPEGSVAYDTSTITAKDAFRVYLEALFKAPDVVIKDRLDGMDILWDVVMPDDSFNGNHFHYIYLFDEPVDCVDMENMTTEDGNKYFKQTPLAQAYYATTAWNHHGIANILIWRTGLYLIAFLLLLVFWWKNRTRKLWWTAVPMLGNLAGSILILYHQSFRYVYFVQLGVVALIFLTVALSRELGAKKAEL